jgi:hypothetical protein
MKLDKDGLTNAVKASVNVYRDERAALNPTAKD